ncbi:MAG: internal scaffolding protein [Microvirus sp.]|nr:MAG: internal scaffolding protein [Microvirus sp.]
MSVFIRTAYNYDMSAASNESALLCDDDSLAVQSARDEADINTIVRRFGLTGELPGDINMPQSGDFAGAPDFHSSMNLVRAAQEEFLRVPADIRARFLNDPGRFVQFFEDPANRPEAERLGLVAPIPVGDVAAPAA